MKRQKLMNDVMQGLLMAATIVAALPLSDVALAQNTLGQAATQSGTDVFQGVILIASYASYTIATIVGISGLLAVKKHADNPGSNPLNPALGKIGVAAALAAFPTALGMLSHTASDVSGNTGVSFSSIGFTP